MSSDILFRDVGVLKRFQLLIKLKEKKNVTILKLGFLNSANED